MGVASRFRRLLSRRHARLFGVGAAAAIVVVAALALPVQKLTDFAARGTPAVAQKEGYRELRWHELTAPTWDAYDELRKLRLQYPAAHGDRESSLVLQKMREVWDSAPANPELEGRAVRIAGYVVPVEQQGGAVTEFLLVPNFGECLHSPPPPANQIIHVKPRSPPARLRAMDTVWVSGQLHAKTSATSMGTSGYVLQEARVEPYVAAR